MTTPTVSPRTSVAVIGAGLTGMQAALTLQNEGVPHRVLESSLVAGGLATTRFEEGFRFDCTGHLLHLRDERIRERVLTWLGEELPRIRRRSAIWSHGVYTRYPFQANTAALPPDVAYHCVVDFIKARQQPSSLPIRNFTEFCLRHFGAGFSNEFLIPYNRKLWGVRPDEISASWCQRFVPIPTLEDVIAGAVGKPSRELGYNSEFYYPKTGIAELSRALHQQLRHIEFDSELLALDVRRKELVLKGGVVRYERLISTIPLPTLLMRIVDPPEEVAAAAQAMRHTRLQYIDLALGAPCGKPYHWIYVPEERYPFYRVGCYSHFSDSMAPAGSSSLYVELVNRDPPDLPRLLPTLAQNLVEMGLLRSSGDIRFARPRTLDVAYVIYDQHHERVTRLAHDYLRAQGIISTGRYGEWNYSSMEDALLFGEGAARLTLSSL